MIEPRLVPGVVHLRSQVAAVVTLDRLEALVRARGLTVFARIEFSRDAEPVGLTVPPMAQLVFGNSRAGTPILAARPAIGLALPLRALAWEDVHGHRWLRHEAPEDLADRCGVPRQLEASLGRVRA